MNEPVGYGQILQGSLKVRMNATNNNPIIEGVYYKMLLQATTVFKDRTLSSINPLKWIEFVILLPTALLRYLNLKSDTATKIVQIIYWLTAAALAGIQFFKSLNS